MQDQPRWTAFLIIAVLLGTLTAINLQKVYGLENTPWIFVGDCQSDDLIYMQTRDIHRYALYVGGQEVMCAPFVSNFWMLFSDTAR